MVCVGFIPSLTSLVMSLQWGTVSKYAHDILPLILISTDYSFVVIATMYVRYSAESQELGYTS